MDRVWCFLLLAVLGVSVFLPGMGLAAEMQEKGVAGMQDAEKASYLLASLYDDPVFMDSLGGGLGSQIRMDEEALADKVRDLYGKDLSGFLLVTEEYVRVDMGEGLGPPRFYRMLEGGGCTFYRRDREVCRLVGTGEHFLACDPEAREAAVYAVEDVLGLERVSMRTGLRIFLSQEVVLPWLGSQKVWKKQRESRIFLK